MGALKEYETHQLGNVKLKASKDADVRVFKCSHLNCPKYFFSYDDLKAHEAIDHGEIPQYLKEKSTVENISAIKGELARIRLKQRLNHMKQTMDLYWEYKKALKDERKAQPMDMRPSLGERLMLWLKGRRHG